MEKRVEGVKNALYKAARHMEAVEGTLELGLREGAEALELTALDEIAMTLNAALAEIQQVKDARVDLKPMSFSKDCDLEESCWLKKDHKPPCLSMMQTQDMSHALKNDQHTELVEDLPRFARCPICEMGFDNKEEVDAHKESTGHFRE